jgi:predicted nucleic acid-binding protein
MKARVYIETSVISYATARPSRDLIVAARQEITRERWDRILTEFDCYVSALVIQEAEGGDPDAAASRLSAIASLPILQVDELAEELALSLISGGAIPKQKPEDALHIALAARDGVDYLLTWNFTHIHNAQMELCIRRIVEQFGYQCPVFCSPDELIGE